MWTRTKTWTSDTALKISRFLATTRFVSVQLYAREKAHFILSPHLSTLLGCSDELSFIWYVTANIVKEVRRGIYDTFFICLQTQYKTFKKFFQTAPKSCQIKVKV